MKDSFTSAPILSIPDPKLFVVGVYTSDVGIKAVLSKDPLRTAGSTLVPCFSKKLSPTERDNGIRNLKLLAVKVSLEE